MPDLAEAPLTVTVKGDGQPPWIVVRGTTPEEVNERLSDVVDAGTVDLATAAGRSLTAAARGEAAPVAPRPVTPTAPAAAQHSPAVQRVVEHLDGQVVEQQTFAAASPSGEPELVGPDRFGRYFEFGHPQAPQTAHGPAVLMHATGQSGKPYSRWLDPRAKAVPGNYEKGLRSDPVDAAVFEDNGFARGVKWRSR